MPPLLRVAYLSHFVCAAAAIGEPSAASFDRQRWAGVVGFLLGWLVLSAGPSVLIAWLIATRKTWAPPVILVAAFAEPLWGFGWPGHARTAESWSKASLLDLYSLALLPLLTTAAVSRHRDWFRGTPDAEEASAF